MREIANSTARTAIETHQKRGLKENSKAKLFGAVCAAVASAAIMYFASQGSSERDAIWQYAAACAGLVIAAYWTLQGTLLSHRSRSSQKDENESVANKD